MSTGNIRDRRKQSKRWIGDSRAVDEDGEPQRRGHVGTFDWFSPDIRYGLKANSPRELIGLKESFQYIPITMGAAIPHGSHC